mmetsp:Transcript_142054/g.345070  ORF Transcript_142054/g.345070 Transcript_142054/m.345070 type:complete len:230 (-) Transcript_142054:224-913(-)
MPPTQEEVEEIQETLQMIGGWWHQVATKYVNEKPYPNLIDLKHALMQDTSAYGVVSAVMMTLAQQEIATATILQEDLLSSVVQQVHINCWYLCFMANMLCLYLSTIEYLNTISTHPKDILGLLARRFPPRHGPYAPEGLEAWVIWVRKRGGKLECFRGGFWVMLPGILCGVFLRGAWPLTVGPHIISVITVFLGWVMWYNETGKWQSKRPPACAGSIERLQNGESNARW